MIGLIPARGGSKGIRRKNLQPVNGVPLFLNACRIAEPFCDTVYVSTDDPVIRDLAETNGYKTIWRDGYTASDTATIADVVEHARRILTQLEHPEPDILVVQPTVPNVKPESIMRLIDMPYGAVLTAPVDHLIRVGDIPLTPTVNRQQLDDYITRSVGVYYYPAGELPRHPTGAPIPPDEALDIDTPTDLWAAQTKPRVLFNVTASHQLGTGHVRRCITLADTLAARGWTVGFSTAHPTNDGLADRILADAGYTSVPVIAPDIVVHDILDTTVADMLVHANCIQVTFEDLGEGRSFASATINAMYPGTRLERRTFTGPKWTVIRPEFLAVNYQVREEAYEDRVLGIFGGTDPSNLAHKLEAVWPQATILKPHTPHEGSIAALMAEHDLLVTSAGRTVFEAAAVGIPTIVMAQNPREASHSHLGGIAGNTFLGSGSLVQDRQLADQIEAHLSSYMARQTMSDRCRMLVDGKGVDRIINLFERLLIERT